MDAHPDESSLDVRMRLLPKGQVFRIRPGITTFGSEAGNQVRAPSLAPHHARVELSATGLVVTALDGEVTVSKRPAELSPVYHGDVLGLGRVRLEVFAPAFPAPVNPDPDEAELGTVIASAELAASVTPADPDRSARRDVVPPVAILRPPTEPAPVVSGSPEGLPAATADAAPRQLPDVPPAARPPLAVLAGTFTLASLAAVAASQLLLPTMGALGAVAGVAVGLVLGLVVYTALTRLLRP